MSKFIKHLINRALFTKEVEYNNHIIYINYLGHIKGYSHIESSDNDQLECLIIFPRVIPILTTSSYMINYSHIEIYNKMRIL